ncbi:hypothetical protein EDB19DRAFT_1832869 [Suillus lakei]|nr:hypothetical protein EDB19DRAFT_1832869 [Suillus lakei]
MPWPKRVHSVWAANLQLKKAKTAKGKVSNQENGQETGNYFPVMCEEIEEEEDIIAIRGVHWREKDQMTFLLEQIQYFPSINSLDSINAVDEEWLPPIINDDIDAESEVDDGNEEEDFDAGAERTTCDYCFEL